MHHGHLHAHGVHHAHAHCIEAHPHAHSHWGHHSHLRPHRHIGHASKELIRLHLVVHVPICNWEPIVCLQVHKTSVG